VPSSHPELGATSYGDTLQPHVAYLTPVSPFAQAREDGLDWLVIGQNDLATELNPGWQLEPIGTTAWAPAELTRTYAEEAFIPSADSFASSIPRRPRARPEFRPRIP
jgi:hypothetical protein